MSTPDTTSLPLPGTGGHAVAAAAPGPGAQNWAGAPSAVLDEDGSIVVGYRVRHAGELRDEVVIARSEDGEQLETVAVLTRDQFGAEMLERPALARTETGTWRAWVGVATPGHEALAHRDARGADPGGPRGRAAERSRSPATR